jgi:uncharacterized RDD family membrane protein YckC
MSDAGPRKIGVSIEVKPHAYDPIANPELFEGVLARRCLAFVIDVIIIAVPVVFAAVFIFIVGLVTLGLGWVLYWLLSPAAVIWALCYYGLTFGSPASATLGMRVMDIEMRTWYGAPAYFVLGAVHAIAYWFTVSFLTPLIHWSRFSITGAGCCTTCWWARSSSTIATAPRRCAALCANRDLTKRVARAMLHARQRRCIGP